MTLKWLFVDEQPEVAEKFATLLTKAGELEVTPVEPEADIAFLHGALREGGVDGVLLDYALNEARADIKYAGSTLAAFLRTEYPYLPIVVLSAGS